MAIEYLPIIFGIASILVHLISERIHIKHKERLISFSIGVSLTYIFLYLFPEIISTGRFNTSIVFSFVLAGIVIIRLVEIHIWKHKSIAVLRRELKQSHSLVFFIYHFVTGMILFELLKFNTTAGVLFSIPILLHTGVSSLSMQEIHGSIRTKGIYKIILSLSTALGIGIMYFINTPYTTIDILFGLVIGAMLYIVMRDAMPKAREAKPREFLSGILFYLAILMLLGVY